MRFPPAPLVAGTSGHHGGMADDGSAAKYSPSPVPSDRRLWPGELPFTAFGQFGEDSLDLRVFDQGTYWVDRTGTAHLLSQMSDAYIVNVINFLTELRDQYFADNMRRAFIQILGDQLAQLNVVINYEDAFQAIALSDVCSYGPQSSTTPLAEM